MSGVTSAVDAMEVATVAKGVVCALSPASGGAGRCPPGRPCGLEAHHSPGKRRPTAAGASEN